jgi:hypothetical protein
MRVYCSRGLDWKFARVVDHCPADLVLSRPG